MRPDQITDEQVLSSDVDDTFLTHPRSHGGVRPLREFLAVLRLEPATVLREARQEIGARDVAPTADLLADAARRWAACEAERREAQP